MHVCFASDSHRESGVLSFGSALSPVESCPLRSSLSSHLPVYSLSESIASEDCSSIRFRFAAKLQRKKKAGQKLLLRLRDLVATRQAMTLGWRVANREQLFLTLGVPHPSVLRVRVLILPRSRSFHPSLLSLHRSEFYSLPSPRNAPNCSKASPSDVAPAFAVPDSHACIRVSLSTSSRSTH